MDALEFQQNQLAQEAQKLKYLQAQSNIAKQYQVDVKSLEDSYLQDVLTEQQNLAKKIEVLKKLYNDQLEQQ